jgi:hypothetical protein
MRRRPVQDVLDLVDLRRRRKRSYRMTFAARVGFSVWFMLASFIANRPCPFPPLPIPRAQLDCDNAQAIGNRLGEIPLSMPLLSDRLRLAKLQPNLVTQ